MGKGYIYTCKKCGEEHRFLLGCGMFSFAEEQLLDLNNSLTNILDSCQDEKEKLHVRKLIKSKEYRLVNGFGYKICKCSTCNAFYNKYTFEFFSRKNKKFYISESICNKCNKELKILTNDEIYNENIPGICKKCNNTTFDIQFLNWD